jgi:hypothetical protein
MGNPEGGREELEEGVWRREGELSNIVIYRLIRNAKEF